MVKNNMVEGKQEVFLKEMGDNTSSFYNATAPSYDVIPSVKPTINVADAKFDKDLRIIVLYIQVIVGAIGGALVCMWLWANRRRKSRVNKLILHVAVSDLLVVFCACLPQLIWEYDREWRAGETFCKMLKFFSSFAMIASSYMVVILSIDRHEAIMYPLRESLAVWKMTLMGWVAAAVFSIPQIIIFRVNYITEEGPSQNMTLCESIFRVKERWVRQAYLTYISLVVFYIPFFIIVFCYVRIFLKIAGKVSEVKNNPKKNSSRPGKIYLQSSQTNSLSKAKVKILKMTVVIVATFAIGGLPYHVVEVIYSYGDHMSVPPTVAAILVGMAVANSAINPFVFLAFNATRNCFNTVVPCIRLPNRDPASVYESQMSTKTDYVGHTTAMTDVTRLNVNLANKDSANAPRKPIYINKGNTVTYQRVESEDVTDGY